jgi:hypothetical protein
MLPTQIGIETRGGGGNARNGRGIQRGGPRPPLRPQGRIGKRNAPVLKDGEVSPLTFPIIATGDRQSAADTGRRPGPVHETPGARTTS